MNLATQKGHKSRRTAVAKLPSTKVGELLLNLLLVPIDARAILTPGKVLRNTGGMIRAKDKASACICYCILS